MKTSSQRYPLSLTTQNATVVVGLAHADTLETLPPEDLRNIKMMLNLLVTQEARDNSECKQTLELARLSAWFARDAHQKGMSEGLQKALLSQQVTPAPSKPGQKKYPDTLQLLNPFV
ncbi:hypothetical protein [Acetobacter orleanensis]|nr:hypothetical protein [Acetobacter orleanensis]